MTIESCKLVSDLPFKPMSIVGEMTVFEKKSGHSKIIQIRFIEAASGLIKFEALTKNDGEKVGIINLSEYSFKHLLDVEKENLVTAEQWYGEEEYKDKITIKWVDSSIGNQKYQSIGTNLVQFAIEYSLLRGKEGRVDLEAVNFTHIFYYKLGFRLLLGAENEDIKKSIKRNQSIKLYSTYMYLPEKIIETWKNRNSRQSIILDNPASSSKTELPSPINA